MKQFKKAFSVLIEQDLTDKEAMQTTLDDGSTPEDFDVDMNSDAELATDSDVALKASQD